MKHTYKKEDAKRRILTAACAAAVLIAVGVIGMFAYAVYLRTVYKGVVREAGDYTTTLDADSMTISCDGETYPATVAEINYYLFTYMLSPYTAPYNRNVEAATERSIVLTLGEGTMTFTPLSDDQNAVTNIVWTKDGSSRGFTVRSQTTFTTLRNYFSNVKRRNEGE